MYKLSYARNKDLSNPYPIAKFSNVSQKKEYFTTSESAGLLSFDNIVYDAPTFDYFKLWDITLNKENDWILLDVYHNGEVAVEGWLVSEKLKEVLENSKIAKPFKFYPAKLMFQGVKLNYYIFQMAWDEWLDYDFQNSTYFQKTENNWIEINPKINDYRDFKKLVKLWEKDDSSYRLKIKLKQKYDILQIQFLPFCISEELKSKIEISQIKGFEISPLKNIEFIFENI